MEKKIIGNIRSDVASLAKCVNQLYPQAVASWCGLTMILLSSCLGMSWICGTTPFSIETKSQGKGRSYLLKNEEQPSGYDVWIRRFGLTAITSANINLKSKHRTNLRFDNWKAEFSDFVFDKPIIRELQPFEVFASESLAYIIATC